MSDDAALKPAVRIIATGGTMSKIHDPIGECLALPPVADGLAHLEAMLREARCDFATLELLLVKDSADFTDADREAIAAAVLRAPERKIVVTHGTSTMGDTARHLAPRLAAAAPDKTVALTGAIRPFAFGASDAPFNLGGALLAAQMAPPGVYGVMNGRLAPAATLVKDVATGRFDR